MAALVAKNSQLADKNQFPLIGLAQTLVADPSITYTTDDPGLTAASVLTVADGDTISAAETLQALTDVHAKIAAILDILEEHGLMKAS